MSDVIDVLEAVGADSDLADCTSASLDALLQREGAEPALRSALLDGDAGALQALLRAPDTVCCLINPHEPDDEDEDEEDDEEEEEGEDDEDDEK